MPEVPQNMQQGLQRMELEAKSAQEPSNHTRDPSLSNFMPSQPTPRQQQQPQRKPTNDNQYSPATQYSPSIYSPSGDRRDPSANPPTSQSEMADVPLFSHFPRVQGDHIPPSDAEKEQVLIRSRNHVLHSNDASKQITWARDVLAFVEIAAEHAARELEAERTDDRDPIQRPTTPQDEHDLRVDAINIVSFLADQGHPEAVFMRGKWHEFGKFGNRFDRKEAYKCYLAAAKQGWGRADYRIGMLYENSNDMESAMRHYHKGLQLGDSAASYRIGMMNLMGQHKQHKDMAKGLELIRAAADSADEDAPQGAFVYGMLVARDLPDVKVPDDLFPSDLALARRYVELAAFLGFPKAQLKMGQAYELCQLGCEFKPELSLHYYGLAARQNQPEACLGVSRWFLFGYEGVFSKNEKLAFKYAQLAAIQKLPTGEFAMGYYYEIGISVEKSISEARRWYELAAEHGNTDAVGRLEGLSQSKTLSKQDHETTTLGRIKSKHGSQRGQRPERFKQQNQAMPTLSEDAKRPSPRPSPRAQAYDNTHSMPDPTRPNSTANGGPQSHWNLNLPNRPKSSAPYPEDEARPPPNAARPASAVPYPEDDMPKPHGGARNPNLRPPMGPSADRPNSAFGIRTQSPGQPGGSPASGGLRPSQPHGQAGMVPAGADPRQRRPVSSNWQGQPQAGPTGYRPSPGASAQGMHQPPAGYDARLGSAPGPNLPPKGHAPPNAGRPGPGGPAVPINSHAPHPSQGPGGRMPAYNGRPPQMGTPAMSGGLGSPMGQPPVGPGGPGGQRVGSGGRPGGGPMDGPSGRMSAAPGQQSRPNTATPASMASSGSGGPSAPPTATSGPPASKPAKTGPSTFDEMGIAHAKKEDECVSVSRLTTLPSMKWIANFEWMVTGYHVRVYGQHGDVWGATWPRTTS